MTGTSLFIHTSNRLDVLAEELARSHLAEPLPPLEREVVVVQSQGMRRWLTLELARRLGIAAGLVMPFPGAFCRDLADRALGADHDAGEAALPSLFDRELLTWRIFAELGEADRSGLWPPAAYLDDDPDQVKRYQLSSRLAGLFERYQLFRPRMMLQWETESAPGARDELHGSIDNTGHRGWQSALWRALANAGDEEPLARRCLRMLDRLKRAGFPPPGLPRRLAVFGVSTLPPIFVELLAALARFIPVRLFFTSPTYHFWGDLRSDREAAAIRRRLRTSRRAPEDDHLESGNLLLASLGQQGRDFFNLLTDADADGEAWHELEFRDPGSSCLLQALQSDVLHLVDRGGPDAPPHILDPGDVSLSVHACHSPRREMEVLRDQLLDAFDRDPALEPADVLVMVPEIDDYAPYVEAVMSAVWRGTPTLPFTIADRRASEERPTADTFPRILALVGARAGPRAVLDLLDTPAIRRAFGIAAGEVPILRRWVRDTRIRWGIDGAQRAADFALPDEEANTWRAGLDRLLMGYAAGDVPELIAGVAPRAGDTAGDAELLGRFASFADTLFGHLRGLSAPRPADAWAADLGHLLDQLYAAEDEDEESALELLRAALFDLTLARELAGLEEPVQLAAVRSHLEARLAAPGFGAGFSSGRVTFCSARPMRSIPFKVICFAGLSEGAFPRRDPRHTFDLIAASPRPGDRSIARDDRYLFLETLLAAGDRLILTYVGRSEKDNTRQAPAAVLSEILDVIDRGFRTADGRPPREVVVVEHRLHPFHPAYFDPGVDPRLYSYSRESRDAATRHGTPPALSPFVRDGLEVQPPAAGAPAEVVDLELRDLIELWVNPAKHFCRRTLQLVLEPANREVDEAEPFIIDFLDRYRIRQWLLDRRLAGAVSGTSELELLRARGELPLSGLGEAAYARLARDVDRFVATLPKFRPAEPVLIDLAGDGWRLGGRLDNLTDAGLLRFRCADLKPKDLVRAWVSHVVHSASEGRRPSGLPVVTHAVGTDRAVRFGALRNAAEILERLITGYREGLESPLPVFERASFACVRQALRREEGAGRAQVSPDLAARRAFDGGRFPGDAADPYVAVCFRDRDPLADPGFARWAQALWLPLMEQMEEVEV